MKLKKTLSALLTATLLASGAQAAEPAKTPATINADPALWVVKDADTTIYLFGTVHMLKPEIQWLDGGVKSAFDASSELVVEIEDTDPAKMAPLVISKAVDPDGPPLSKKLSPKTLALLKAQLEKNNVPVAAMEKFEPWYIASLLSLLPMQNLGYSPESGVDKRLIDLAKRGGKKVIGLETVEQQLDYFDTLSEAQQIRFLEATLKDLPAFPKMVEAMIDAWSKGKAAQLGRSMGKSMKATPDIAKRLLGDRNARWADWIKARLDRPGTSFVAVGAGHLAGKDSVQDMLKSRKIKAVRIPS